MDGPEIRRLIRFIRYCGQGCSECDALAKVFEVDEWLEAEERHMWVWKLEEAERLPTWWRERLVQDAKRTLGIRT